MPIWPITACWALSYRQAPYLEAFFFPRHVCQMAGISLGFAVAAHPEAGHCDRQV